jgi:hypothetical protein
MTSPSSDEPRCRLCDGTPADWCYGCRAYICDNHYDNPWGPHDREDHDNIDVELEEAA